MIPGITVKQRAVYVVDDTGKSYFTRRAACKGLAYSRMCKKYPPEKQERDGIGVTYSGWHWLNYEKHRKTFNRYSNMLFRLSSPKRVKS